MTKPIVAIVGRPNVGKSTLFNRLIGERLAIVEEIPGTTRDRLYRDVEWEDRVFTLVDTGGLADASGSAMADLIQEQAEVAIAEADVIILVGDAILGTTSADHDVAELLRVSGKPVLLVANKAEKAEHKLAIADFYQLALGEPISISALHGRGTGDLLDEVVARLPDEQPATEQGDTVRLAIVGRPNVGKSSIANTLLGEERSIVSDIPGTTRDAIDSVIEFEGHRVVLVDTAGIRRRGRVDQGVEKYSVLRALRALDRCDVALMVLDATEGVLAQDTHVASHIVESGKGVVLVVNKWDAVEKDSYTTQKFEREIRTRFKFLDFAPIVFVSALSGQRLPQMLRLALRAADARHLRVQTSDLNRVVTEAIDSHQPPSLRGRSLRIHYVTQAEVAPPTFVFFVNDAELVHFTYARFLENRLRAAFTFFGAPIRLLFRGKGETR